MSATLLCSSLQNGTEPSGSPAQQGGLVSPWCWVYVKSQLLGSRSLTGPSRQGSECETGKELLVWVRGQPGFPARLLPILFFLLLGPKLWDTEKGGQGGSSTVSQRCPWLPRRGEISWKQPCQLTNSSPPPAALVRGRFRSADAVLEQHQYFSLGQSAACSWRKGSVLPAWLSSAEGLLCL